MSRSNVIVEMEKWIEKCFLSSKALISVQNTGFVNKTISFWSKWN